MGRFTDLFISIAQHLAGYLPQNDSCSDKKEGWTRVCCLHGGFNDDDGRDSCSRGKGVKVPRSLSLPLQVRIRSQLPLESLRSQKVGNWEEIRDA